LVYGRVVRVVDLVDLTKDSEAEEGSADKLNETSTETDPQPEPKQSEKKEESVADRINLFFKSHYTGALVYLVLSFLNFV
jgi:hypothetical protein